MSDAPDISPVVGTVGSNKLMNWNGYKIVAGHGKSTFLLDEIQYRRRAVKQNMILICGSPGEGKSYFALRLAQILDDKFNPYEQIAFERTHLLNLIGTNSPLKMGQAIVIDEAQFIAGARRWYEDVQKDVMENIEAIRSKGFVILIVALHLNLLDKIVRNYVLSHMMKMTTRGKATVYSLWTPTFADKLFRKRLGKMQLQLPDYELCAYSSCLICKFLDKCYTLRAIYERLKREFLGKMSEQSREKAVRKEKLKVKLDYKDLVEKAAINKNSLMFTKAGMVEPESVRMIFENKFKITLSDADARRVIKRGMITYPDIFTQKETA
jgi:hypothetical protein